jgi:glycolate oxidase iron-sulfur subunit
VQYGKLVDIGRKWAEENTPERPLGQRFTRWALKEGLTTPALFNSAMALGRLVRPLMPSGIQRKIPLVINKALHSSTDAYTRPTAIHQRKMILLEGCVQPGMLPNINSATARVLNALKIQLISAPSATCCGALRYHLNDQAGGLESAKQNINAWWPLVENGIEAIVMTASGCGVMVKDYGHLFANDPVYAAKAKKISELTKDISEILPSLENELGAMTMILPVNIAWNITKEIYLSLKITPEKLWDSWKSFRLFNINSNNIRGTLESRQ